MRSTRGDGPAHRATHRRASGRVLVRHVLLVSVGAVLAACGDSPTTPRESAPAYDPYAFAIDESGVQHRYLYHWPAGRTIRVYVDPTAEPAGSDLRGAVVSAASLWGGTVRNGEVAVAIAFAPGQADVIVHYGEAPRLVGPGDCAPPASGGSGSTFLCPDFATGTLVVLPLLAGGGGSVKMDVAVYRSAVADDAQFRRVVAHELGHVLGIGAHSASSSDLMFGAPAVSAPSPADAQTLRYVLQHPADLAP